jgi:hypothetical protein
MSKEILTNFQGSKFGKKSEDKRIFTKKKKEEYIENALCRDDAVSTWHANFDDSST